MRTLLRKSVGPIVGLVVGQLARVRLQLGGEDAKRRRRANRLASSMLAEFSRLGFTKRVDLAGRSGRRRRTVRQRVKFEYPLLMTKDELWCPIDLARLPFGVRTDDLCDESVLRSMEDRLDAPVSINRLATGKLCFVVRLSGHKFPPLVSINAIKVPADAAPLTVPAGVDGYGEPVFLDLLACKHLLVAGSTGGGKTTFQHAMITTLLARNDVSDLELWLIDMKRAEFSLYKPLMGAKGEGVVRHIAVDPEDAIGCLDQCFREIDRRNKLMEKYGATNIDDLRKTHNIRLRRIVLIVDEFAILTTDSTRMGRESVGGIATRLMTRIASLGRSAGVSIIIATQMINKDVLSGTIRANFENRVCFSVADWRQSQLVIETSEADGLPAGRAVMRIEGRASEVQTAYITPRQVRTEVSRIAEFGPTGTGQDEELARFIAQATLLVTAACQQLEGKFSRDRLLQLEGIRGLVSKDSFNEIAARLERDGVLMPAHGNAPRRVAAAFYGRPNLISAMYGSPAAAERAADTAADSSPADTIALLSADEPAAVAGQPDAPEQAAAAGASVGSRPIDDITHARGEADEDDDESDDDDEPGDLGPFRKLLG